MEEQDCYLMVDLRGKHLESTPRYEVDRRPVKGFANPVRIRWPDGTVTGEWITERRVTYEAAAGGKLVTRSMDLQTIAPKHLGARVLLGSLDGLSVNVDDVLFAD